jgi:hypothetical protein
MTLRELMDAWERRDSVMMTDAEGTLYVGTPEVLQMLPDRNVAVVLRVGDWPSGTGRRIQIIYGL